MTGFRAGFMEQGFSGAIIIDDPIKPEDAWSQSKRETANRRLEQMMPELMKSAGVTEALKASDPMKWVGLMNTLKAQAEELVLTELIYS